MATAGPGVESTEHKPWTETQKNQLKSIKFKRTGQNKSFSHRKEKNLLVVLWICTSFKACKQSYQYNYTGTNKKPEKLATHLRICGWKHQTGRTGAMELMKYTIQLLWTAIPWYEALQTIAWASACHPHIVGLQTKNGHQIDWRGAEVTQDFN